MSESANIKMGRGIKDVLKHVDKKDVARYVLLPGIIPQIKELTRGGFSYLAYLIAIVYRSVKILPDNHTYVQPANFGTYGIRQVIAAAANNLTLKKKNIDQIAVFFAIIAAMVILALQFVALILLVFSGEAFAQGTPPADLFTTGNPEKDIAFMMMREVFGIPDMFGPLDGGRSPFHQALHAMLNFYNLALLLVAVLVFIYYLIVVVAETAQTGTPFGKRFSHLYAPFRLVIAIGLLVPLNYGLNGSQYVTLYAAKLGSGFATNAWTRFNDGVPNPTGADNSTLIAETRAPDIEGLVEFMAVAAACRRAYSINYGTDIDTYIYTEQNGRRELVQGSISQAIQSAEGQDPLVVFGAQEIDNNSENIIPYCGSVKTPMNVSNQASSQGGDPGDLQKKYAELVQKLWDDQTLQIFGNAFVNAHNNGKQSYHPDDSARQNVIETYKTQLRTLVQRHYNNARQQANFDMLEETKERGWGGAGIWYNRIAQVNGAFVVATFGIPAGHKFPKVMEDVLTEKRAADRSFEGCEAFNPNLADNTSIDLGNDNNNKTAALLNDVYKYWACHRDKNAANFFLDTASAIFGLNGLMSIRDSVEGPNGQQVQVHPLAKLSALGRGMVESSIRSLGLAMGTSFLGGMLGILNPHLGAAGDAASQMFVSIATVGLSIGFLTYYILPFLPFIYFFFAVGSWVKSIFEAMVGAPLWALAHLRIDGDGIPGKMAGNGYFLIFEIFLRPILTVIGLLGGMAIFTAMANTLNEIFDIVVQNTAKIDLSAAEKSEYSRGIVDVFFFTCVYAVILYLMALSSFKMINLVPNMILRWMGSSASAFSDNTKDPTEGLTNYAAIGGAKIGGEIAGAGTQAAQGVGSAIGVPLGAAFGKTGKQK